MLFLATTALVLFTFMLWHSTDGLWKVTRSNSLQLARDEFNATHRPELIVREAYQDWEGPTASIEVIAFTIANRGSAPCQIVESRFELLPREVDGQALLTEGKNELGNLKFAAGGFHRVSWELPAGIRVGIFEDHYFRGTMIYMDSSNVQRRYVITRYQQRDSKGFVRTKNPDDEYTD